MSGEESLATLRQVIPGDERIGKVRYRVGSGIVRDRVVLRGVTPQPSPVNNSKHIVALVAEGRVSRNGEGNTNGEAAVIVERVNDSAGTGMLGIDIRGNGDSEPNRDLVRGLVELSMVEAGVDKVWLNVGQPNVPEALAMDIGFRTTGFEGVLAYSHTASLAA